MTRSYLRPRHLGARSQYLLPIIKVGGAAFGTDPQQAAAVTKAVKDATDLPVI